MSTPLTQIIYMMVNHYYSYWDSPNATWQFQKFNDKSKPQHKYEVDDLLLDTNSGLVGVVKEKLSWPDYLIGNEVESWVCDEHYVEPLCQDQNVKIKSHTASKQPECEKIDTGPDIRLVDTILDAGSQVKEISNQIITLNGDVNRHNCTLDELDKKVVDIEKRQRRVSRLSKLAFLGRLIG